MWYSVGANLARNYTKFINYKRGLTGPASFSNSAKFIKLIKIEP